MRIDKFAKLIALLLGSAWFIPVSCTTIGVGIAHLSASRLEHSWTNTGERDDRVRRHFHIVALPGADNAAFNALNFLQLEEFKRSNPTHSFLMREDAGNLRIDTDHTSYRYKILARSSAGQEIEVTFSDGDNDYISRYRATASEVTPVAWRPGPLDRGVLMPALTSGLVVALALYPLGKLLGWLLRRRFPDDAESET
jgi:hypothetical protein